MGRFVRRRGARPADDEVSVLRGEDGAVWHTTGPLVAASLRHSISHWQVSSKAGVPARLALTATLGGEGTTFVSRSLADLIASDLQRSVCLVDLNWWAPAPPPRTGAHPGLAGVLRGDVTLAEALVSTSNPLLWALPAGQASGGERSMLAQGTELRTQLDELEERFDHLVLDVPAVLRCGEAVALASLAEGTVLVVQQGTTTIEQVRASLDQLSFSPVLGLVLNRATSRIPQWLNARIAAA